MPDLSVLIPARNEEWLKHTVEDVCRAKRGDTNVIVVLDGQWPMQGLQLAQHPDVDVAFHARPIGQRAATNLAAQISTARYICKLDAHCSVGEGFDVTLLEAAEKLEREVVQIPQQRHLHVYDWVCPSCQAHYDQSPVRTECNCGSKELTREVVWQPRARPTSDYWRFDSDLHFQYDRGRKAEGQFIETMSCLGACWFLNREWFWELGGLDEGHGSWGQMGTELACKAWLSGGRMVTNRSTYFAHFFRVGGHKFPYEIHSSDQEYAKRYSQTLWRGNLWSGQKRPLRWLVEKFWPVAGWTEEQRESLRVDLPARDSGGTVGAGADGVQSSQRIPPSRTGVSRQDGSTRGSSAGIVYYTDGCLDHSIDEAVRLQLESCGLPIVAISLKHIEWPAARLVRVWPLERGYLSMFKQILAGLEELDTEYAFLAEHDCLYTPEHFQFRPPNDSTYCYNLNWWRVDAASGRALTYRAKQVSQLCANRELLIEHYRKRIAIVERDGFSMKQGFEPGSHNRKQRIDTVLSVGWRSEVPNIDIRHGSNLTPSRWRREQFKDQSTCEEWQEADGVPGWGITKGRFWEFLRERRGSGVAA